METVRRGIKHLPTPGDDLFTEDGFDFQIDTLEDGTQIRIVGYVDYASMRAAVPLIGDHKFTKNLRWAMTEEECITDPQGVVYSYATHLETGAEAVQLEWVYYEARPNTDAEDGRPRESRRVRKVAHLFTLAEMQEGWEGILHTSRLIAVAKLTVKAAMDMEPEPMACSAYGGCPFRDDCTDLTPATRLGARMRQFNRVHGTGPLLSDPQPKGSPMSLMDSIKARNNASAAALAHCVGTMAPQQALPLLRIRPHRARPRRVPALSR